MLTPKKVKHRKWQKGRRRSRTMETRGTELSFGAYGLRALEAHWLTARQLEAARRAMTRFVQRGGKIWIRVFPDKPVTQRPPEVTMGGGKGAVSHYVVPVRPGRIIFEMDGVPEGVAREALRLAAHKLPLETQFVKK